MRAQTPAEHLVEDGLLTIRAATEFSGLMRSSLYRLMEAGDLPYVKIGRSRRIPKRALIALAARHLIGGNEA